MELNINDSSPLLFGQRKVFPDSTNVLDAGNCVETQVPDSSKIMIFIFDAHTLETVSWKTVIDEKLYLKRYDLSVHDIESMGWKFSYP